VRYFWDLVLQGNIRDIGTVASHAYHTITDCNTELLHLLVKFPNNYLGTKIYPIFVKIILADHFKFNKFSKVTSDLYN
jgi:hypothetical protein